MDYVIIALADFSAGIPNPIADGVSLIILPTLIVVGLRTA